MAEKMRMRFVLFSPSLFLFLLFLPLSLRLPALAMDNLITKPEFSAGGEIVAGFRAGDSGGGLQVIDPSSGNPDGWRIELGPGAGLPKLKKDGLGRLWAVWSVESDPRGLVVMGLIERSLDIRARLRTPIRSSLPWDFTFDSEEKAWLMWVEDSPIGQRVHALDAASGRSWIISSPAEEANSPRILCDSAGNIWAFWTKVTPDGEQVFASVFDGAGWSGEQPMTSGPAGPRITPRAAAGRDGTVWLVWSGYDGRDYEIFARLWDGRNWSAPAALTDNSGENDVFPSVDLAFGALPVVSWVRYSAGGRREYVRCRAQGGWLAELELPSPAGSSPFVPLAIRDDLAAVARSEGESLRVEPFFLSFAGRVTGRDDRLPGLRSGAPAGWLAALPGLIYNPALREHVYIAFGDSITSGVCDEDGIDQPTDYVPEKAYPPRLEVLLTQSYGEHEVVNEGVPGESTFQGLARFDALLAEHRARYVLILEGTNDIIWNDYSLDTTAFNLREMIRRSLEFGLLPAVATCIPKYGRNAFPVRLTNLNARIRLLAAERPVPLVDLNLDFAQYPAADGGPESLYCWGEDRTHPNEKGSQFMAEKWFERIRNFPFPAADVRARRAADEILFYRSEGNLLEWADSPKILDPARVQEYRVYRKKNADSPSAFRLLASVAGRYSYFDADIAPGTTYTYVLATVVPDNLEGPSTAPLNQ